MGFTTTALAGQAVLVEGTDVRGNSGTEVLDSTQWEEIKSKDVLKEALSLVDTAIAELVAPITAAVEAANESLKAPALDPLFYVVEQEETDHVYGQSRLLTKLNRDSVLLRAIEEGKGDRLIWVKDELVVTAQAVTPAVPAAPDDAVGDATA